jgi:hypothetical protein
MSGHDAAAVQEAFKKQDAMMRQIYEKGFAEYVKGLADFGRAFVRADNTVRCIDEGTPGGVHLAGSGILLGVEKAAEALKLAGAEGITSHAECGAAGIYARTNGLDAARADDYGKEFAAKLSEKTGLPYIGHIDIGKMARPSGYHVARVAYIDGTGKFDCSLVAGLPAGFVVGRRFVSAAYALEEAKVCVGIATGDHGFGELITAGAPFVLVVIGDEAGGEFGLETLKKELEPLVAAGGGKVKVDGFVAP